MNNLEKNELRTQFNKAVKVSYEAIQKIHLEYGDSIYDADGNLSDFVDRFKKHFSVICQNNCVDTSKYKDFANSQENSFSYFCKQPFIVQDGMMFCFTKTTSDANNLYITIDINGPKKKPNRWGYDAFTFVITPTGQKLKAYDAGRASCTKSNPSSSSYNGAKCAAKVFSDPDYFKKL